MATMINFGVNVTMNRAIDSTPKITNVNSKLGNEVSGRMNIISWKSYTQKKKTCN